MLAQGSRVSLALPHVEPWGASIEPAGAAHVDLDVLLETLHG
jgi:hypothetical protein